MSLSKYHEHCLFLHHDLEYQIWTRVLLTVEYWVIALQFIDTQRYLIHESGIKWHFTELVLKLTKCLSMFLPLRYNHSSKICIALVFIHNLQLDGIHMADWIHPYQVVPGSRIYNSFCYSIEHYSTTILCFLFAPRRIFGVVILVLIRYIYSSGI